MDRPWPNMRADCHRVLRRAVHQSYAHRRSTIVVVAVCGALRARLRYHVSLHVMLTQSHRKWESPTLSICWLLAALCGWKLFHSFPHRQWLQGCSSWLWRQSRTRLRIVGITKNIDSLFCESVYFHFYFYFFCYFFRFLKNLPSPCHSDITTYLHLQL